MLTRLIGDVQTIEDVIVAMRAVELALPENDGVKWFNLLYRRVTEAIHADTASWADWPFLQRFDVVFAKLYFEALASWDADPDRARQDRALPNDRDLAKPRPARSRNERPRPRPGPVESVL